MNQDVRAPKALDTYALTDRVYEVLRSRIIDLQLAPGERLNVGQLKEELGVSHTPIREPLNRLASERLVTVVPYNAFDDLRAHIQIARYYRGKSIGEARQAQVEHHRLLAALTGRDPDAVLHAVVDHMRGVYDRLQTGAFTTEGPAR